MSRIVLIHGGRGGELEEAEMKIFVLAVLFALGAVLVAPSGASAAPISGTSNAVGGSSLLEPVYYACRNVRVCHSYTTAADAIGGGFVASGTRPYRPGLDAGPFLFRPRSAARALAPR